MCIVLSLLALESRSDSAFIDINSSPPLPCHPPPSAIQVVVLNGLCESASTCTAKRLPYGLPVPGVSTQLDSDASDGRRLNTVALLGMRSCCGALQRPYSILGLGPFANFVENLFVSIPSDSDSVRPRSLTPLSDEIHQNKINYRLFLDQSIGIFSEAVVCC